MAEQVRIYDLSGNFIADPERAIDRASGITFETRWPQGYAVCSFKVKRSDVFADWAIRESYGVKVFDGATPIYQGRIETLSITAGGVDEYITVECAGWYVILQERQVKKWWVDIMGIKHLEWPAGVESDERQLSWWIDEHDNIINVRGGTKDRLRTKADIYREYYELPFGTVRRVRFGYAGRTGERLRVDVWNLAAGASEYNVVVLGDAFKIGSVNYAFTLASTRKFELQWGTDRNQDLYDQNDYLSVSNLIVEANYETGHRSISNPTYTQGQLIEDILLMVAQTGQQLSADFSQLADPGQILNPYALEEWSYAGSEIDKITAYGDANLNTWGLCVWDDADTSDGLPRVVLEARSVADYEYEASVRDLTTPRLAYAKISEKLRNNVRVSYEDAKGLTRYRTRSNNPALADTASIANEYQRDDFIQLGQGNVTKADIVGSRYIAYHKDRLTRASLAKKGWITTKGGGRAPANRVRAGQRVKLIETGEILFIRQTNYDAESQTVAISPDVAEDNISMLFLQRERGMGRLA